MERLLNLFLQDLANVHKLTLEEMADRFDKCIKKVSLEFDIPYDKIYSSIVNYKVLNECLVGKCDEKILKECEKMCTCVIYENKCVPRFIKDAEIINKDPELYANKMDIDELEKLVDYASFLYFNYEGGGLTDNAFDGLQYHLRKLKKERGVYFIEKVGAKPLEKLATKLPYSMPSLTKIKPEYGTYSYLEGVKNSSYDLISLDKLDGVSGMAIYKKGILSKIFTRGDGNIGGDITFLKETINIPKNVDVDFLVVRGEFVIKKQVYNTKYKTIYANSRSFVSANINTGYILPTQKDIDFVAYSILDCEKSINNVEKKSLKLSSVLKILNILNFKTVEHIKYDISKLLISDLVFQYKERKASGEYDIDGLVLGMDTPYKFIDQDFSKAPFHPDFIKAFKVQLTEQLRDTVVKNVKWELSRYGRFVPVVMFDPVYIQGVKITKASAHNARYVMNNHLGKGAKIKIARSGDVIPAIKNVNVDKNIDPVFPDDYNSDFIWEWDDKRMDVLTPDPENNSTVKYKKLLHFFETIKVKQFGPKRVENATESIDRDFDTTLNVIGNMKKDEFKKIKGIGATLSNTIYESLHTSLSSTRIDILFSAFTFFKSTIGKTLFRRVVRLYPGIMKDTSQEIQARFKKYKIKGIGVKRIEHLISLIPKLKEKLKGINVQDAKQAIENDYNRIMELDRNGPNPKIKDKDFVFTGFMGNVPDYIENYIIDNLGNISSSINNNTTALITNNFIISDKINTAYEKNVRIFSIKEFEQEFGIKN